MTTPASIPLERPTFAVLERVEEHLATTLRKVGIPTAAYAVVWRGEIVLAGGFGTTQWDHGDPVTADTLFGIGSLTKSMTATALLQLQELGEVDLDAPVQQYLPWFATTDSMHAAAVTVRHLLNQTSGLGNGAWRVALDDPSLDSSLERTVRALSSVAPTCTPGEGWAYSNAGFSVAGMVAQEVSGLPYATYLEEHILIPAGMSRTSLDPAQVQRLGYARPYQKRLGRMIQLPLRMDPSFAPAGLAMYSTANDMARYLIAHMDGKLLRADSTADAWRGQAQTPMDAMGEKYGLGWMITDLDGTNIVFHHGGTEGHSAAMWILPEDELGFVLLAGTISTSPTKIAMDVAPMLQPNLHSGAAGLPGIEKVIAVLAALLGVIGVSSILGSLAARASGVSVPLWLAVTLVLLTGLLWTIPGVLRRSQSSPFPVPLNVGGWGWGTGLALGWTLFIAGLSLSAVFALLSAV